MLLIRILIWLQSECQYVIPQAIMPVLRIAVTRAASDKRVDFNTLFVSIIKGLFYQPRLSVFFGQLPTVEARRPLLKAVVDAYKDAVGDDEQVNRRLSACQFSLTQTLAQAVEQALGAEQRNGPLGERSRLLPV